MRREAKKRKGENVEATMPRRDESRRDGSECRRTSMRREREAGEEVGRG